MSENMPAQQQEPPGRTGEMRPKPDHGEESYRGYGRLEGKAALQQEAAHVTAELAGLEERRRGAEQAAERGCYPRQI